MSKPIDPQTKNEIMSALKTGMSQMEASRLYGVSPKTISIWCRQDVVGGEKNYITKSTSSNEN